ncbi:hypothetical protein ACKC9G_03730 [Pokkaliibacter sp. CJK22405]|uniref:hypothetical protein n=1 Tax=Pokkaliibacter sp. CJK22405 TaxID=3384615 RepID=UPI003985516B
MSTKLLRNRDIYNYLLEYDNNLGPLREISAANTPDSNIEKKGTYIKLGADFFGIIASKNGPLFFANQQQFPINSTELTFTHSRGEEQHTFTCHYQGKQIINLTYDRWDDIDIDPWSDEDFIDFFIWLTKSSKNHDFINQWTD